MPAIVGRPSQKLSRELFWFAAPVLVTLSGLLALLLVGDIPLLKIAAGLWTAAGILGLLRAAIFAPTRG